VRPWTYHASGYRRLGRSPGDTWAQLWEFDVRVVYRPPRCAGPSPLLEDRAPGHGTYWGWFVAVFGAQVRRVEDRIKAADAVLPLVVGHADRNGRCAPIEFEMAD